MDSTNRNVKTRAGSNAIILMGTESNLFGVYQAGAELYPARWDVNGYFFPQEEGKPEYKTALDLILNEARTPLRPKAA